MPNPLLRVVSSGVPKLAKHLPKLWPLLLESKNRDRVADAARQLSNASPTKRLQGQIDLTAVMADAARHQAEDAGEAQRASEWVTRARKLRLRVDVPQVDRASRKQQRASVRAQLARLQQEIDDHLSG